MEPDSRAAWVAAAVRLAEPVATAFATGRLHATMPVEARDTTNPRVRYSYLEALARTLVGIGPWLAARNLPEEEAATRDRLRAAFVEGINRASSADAADALVFDRTQQNLVEAAFFAQGLLRAGDALWPALDADARRYLLGALATSRTFTPGENNWLLFAAMVEAFLQRHDGGWNPAPVEHAFARHESWYKGDGAYGDGANFHWDYYNSFVIHPMLVEIAAQLEGTEVAPTGTATRFLRRSQRYAAVQERLIAPDGSYPVIGRSMAYRCGAFQLLAQLAWREQLPTELEPAAVRGSLGAVIGRTLGAEGSYDADGWLRIGLAGHQPDLGEVYITTGSLYLASAAFLPLGLNPARPFWSDPPAPWTSRRAWIGEDLPADHALHEE